MREGFPFSGDLDKTTPSLEINGNILAPTPDSASEWNQAIVQNRREPI